MNIANLLSVSRIVATPIIAYLLFTGTFNGALAALLLFLASAFTDFLDGKLARTLRIHSRLGQFLDPLADKILVVGTFTALAVLFPALVPWWAVVLIVARDVLITGLRIWHESHQRSLKTFFIAKAKTSVQLIFLTLMLVLVTAARSTWAIREPSEGLLDSSIPWFLTVGVTAFTVWTGLVYVFSRDATTPVQKTIPTEDY